jgi:hypothetical protein
MGSRALASWIPACAGMAVLVAVFFLMAGKETLAADRCYMPEQTAAEQLLRLHSELMVITVTCRQSSQGQDLVRAYTGFTNAHIGLLKNAEATLTSYYSQNYGGDGISRLDKLRTQLGNEFGQQVAAQSAPVFCAQRRDKVIALTNSPPSAINQELMRLAAVRTYEPACAGPPTIRSAQVR